MSAAHEGGCHCRALRYSIDGAFRHASYCHCRMCQLTMGSPVGAYANLAPEQFRYTAGTPNIYRSSDKAQREFCGTCGAQLVFRRTDKNGMAVNIVTLDDPSAVEPTLHIWTQSRIPWFDTRDAHERRAKSHA